MATERVTIVVSSKGTVTVKKDIEGIGSAAKKSASGVDLLKGALAGLGTYLSVTTLTKYADAYTNIQNRLKVVTSGTAELTAATDSLYNIAQKTYSSFEGVSTIFARTAQATAALGYSTQDAMKFTEQLSKATALSGVSAESANAALVQLSQGLASGTLRGEELNSLLEQLPYAANALAKGLGVPIGKLRELGEQGLLTPKMIIDAFNKMSTSIDADFANLTPTIAMGLQVIENGFTRLLGYLNDSTGAFGMLASALVFVGNNLEYFAIALSPVLLGLTALAARSLIVAGVSGLGAIVQAIGLLVPALTLARNAMIALNLAILANPMVLITAAIAAAVAGLLLLGQHILQLMGLWDGFLQAAINAFNTVYEYAASFLNFVTGGNWSIDIIDNGASEAIVDAGNTVSSEFTSSISAGGDTASDTIRGGIFDGSAQLRGSMDDSFVNGSNAIKDGIDSGSMSFMQALKQTFADIIEWFRSLFAKATADMKAAAAPAAFAKSGGGAAGALKKEAGDSAKKASETISNAIDNSGQKAAKSIDNAGEKAKKAIAGGGGAAGAAIEKAVEKIYNVSKIGISNDNRPSAFGNAIGSGSWRLGGAVGKTMSGGSTTLSRADPTSKDFAPAHKFRTGGQFMVGGTGGEDSQTVSFRASPNERVTVETPAQQRATDRGASSPQQQAPVNITNNVDPRSMVDVMASRTGRDTIYNTIALNPDKVRRALGL